MWQRSPKGCVCAPSLGYHPSREITAGSHWWHHIHSEGWQGEGGMLVCKNWNYFSLFHTIHDICKGHRPDCNEDGSSQMDCYNLDNPSQTFWEDTVNPDSPSQVCLESCFPGDSRFWKVDGQPSHHHRTLEYWEYLFVQNEFYFTFHWKNY